MAQEGGPSGFLQEDGYEEDTWMAEGRKNGEQRESLPVMEMECEYNGENPSKPLWSVVDAGLDSMALSDTSMTITERSEKKPMKTRVRKVVGRREAIQVDEHYYHLLEQPSKRFKDLPLTHSNLDYLPRNDDIFKMKVRTIGRKKWNNRWKNGKVVTIEFNTIEMSFTAGKNKFFKYSSCDVSTFRSCVLYTVNNVDNDAYWIVLLKVLKFSGRFLGEMGIPERELVSLVRDIKPRKWVGDSETRCDSIDKGLYDIQIIEVDLESYTVLGYRWRRDTGVTIPFFFQILKSDCVDGEGASRYYVLTNLYTHDVDKVLMKDSVGEKVTTCPIVAQEVLPHSSTDFTYVEDGRMRVWRYPMTDMHTFDTTMFGTVEEYEAMAKESGEKGEPFIMEQDGPQKRTQLVEMPLEVVFTEDYIDTSAITKDERKKGRIDAWFKTRSNTKSITCRKRMDMNLTFAISIPYTDDSYMDEVFLTREEVNTFFIMLGMIDSEGRLGLPPTTPVDTIIAGYEEMEPQPMEQIEETQEMVPIEDPLSALLNGNPEK